MRYFIQLSAIILIILATACHSSSRQQTGEETTLTVSDSVSFDIDDSTNYLSDAMFQFEENGKEYLSFLNIQSQQKIHLYEMGKKHPVKTILLPKDNKYSMRATGCHPLNTQKFIITASNGRFWIVNDKGEVEKACDFWKDGSDFQAFDRISFRSNLHRPAVIKDSILYFSQTALKFPRKKDEWDKVTMFAYANLKNKQFGWSDLCYPLIMENDEETVEAFLYDLGISYSYTGKDMIVSLNQYDSILVSSDFKHKKAYNAKSRYLRSILHPVAQGMLGDVMQTIRKQGKLPNYYHMMYDKYRKVSYRFALMPDDNIQPFSQNPQRAFSVIILDENYNIIGETLFPPNTYNLHMCFVGKKGLYISTNNENREDFDENHLKFHCFTLTPTEE